MIEINVNGSVVSVQHTEALYCGAKGVYTCCFSFDSSWKPFSKSAVFRVGGRTMTVLLDEKGQCALPWELLQRDNTGCSVEVGMYGVSADGEVLTGVWDSLGTVREGSELGDDAREPSAEIYRQIMASVQQVDSKVTDHNTKVQVLTQRAESAGQVASRSAEEAKRSELEAKNAGDEAKTALAGVREAINAIPAGSTPVVNDLTTGGKTAALSAEMGRQLEQSKVPAVTVYYSGAMNADDLTVPLALIPVSNTSNAQLRMALGNIQSFAYVRTIFYSKADTASNRVQIAFGYRAAAPKMVFRTYHASDGGWSAWKDFVSSDDVAAYVANNAVAQTGGNMSGNLSITKANPLYALNDTIKGSAMRLLNADNTVLFQNFNVSGDAANRRHLNLYNSAAKANVAEAVKVVDVVDNAVREYTVLHTGNKPSGSYTGNGDASMRKIDTKGLGGVVAIWGGVQVTFVTANGTINRNVSTGADAALPFAQANFANGVLTLATTSPAVNASGVTYYYQVL